MKQILSFLVTIVLLLTLSLTAFPQGWNVEMVGSCYNFWGKPWCVEVSEDYAYLGTWDSGFRVIDISDSSNPYEISYSQPSGDIFDIEISGDYAYIAASSGGLEVVDISDPDNPTVVGNYAPSGNINNVVVSDDYAYVTVRQFGLGILDVSDPTSPEVICFMTLPEGSHSMEISEDYLYIGFLNMALTGLMVVDVSNPALPSMVGFLESYPINSMDLTGDSIYATTYGSQLLVINISDPTIPEVVDSTNIYSCRSILVHHEYAYVASINNIMHILDLANGMMEVGFFETPDIPRGITARGNIVYLTDESHRLHLIDVSDAANPLEVGALRSYGQIQDAAVLGDYVYTANWYAGLCVIDVSNPTDPVEVGQCDAPLFCDRIITSGQYAYIGNPGTTEPGGIRVIDISDPTNPEQVGEYASWDNACRDMEIVDDYLYMADRYGLRVLGIADPENLSEISYLEISDRPKYIGIYDNYCYLSTDYSPSWIINISNPYAPVIEGSFGAHGDLVASDNYVYAAGSNGVHVFDVTNISNPQQVGYCQTPSSLHKLVLSGNYLFLANGNNGFRVIDISDPINPYVSGYYEEGIFVFGLDVSNQYVYAGVIKMSIFDCSAALPVVRNRNLKIPITFSLFPAYPNPFNPVTTLSFSIPKATNVSLKVYDITGRHVTTLVNGWRDMGTYHPLFDASDLASGVYFYRLESPNFSKTKKIVLLK